MVDIARLAVDLSLTGNFGKGIKGAQSQLKGFTAGAKRAETGLGRIRGVVSDPRLKQSLLQGVGLGGGVAGFAAISTAITTVIDQTGAAINAASDLTESQSKVDAVFSSQAVTVRRWASQLDASFGLTERAALEAAGTLGNFLQAMGTTEDEASRLSRDITELAGDLSSFNNTPVDDVLLALRSGLAGESEPVRRLGIDISAARIEAELLERGVKKLNGTFTQGQKVLGRSIAIFEDTTKAQGDAARTADDFAGKQRQLNARLGDLQARVGGLLIPLVSEVASGFIAIAEAADGAADLIGDLARALGTLQAPLQEAQRGIEEFSQPLDDMVGRDLLNDAANGFRVFATGGLVLIPDHAGAAQTSLQDLGEEVGILTEEVKAADLGLIEYSAGIISTRIETRKATDAVDEHTDAVEDTTDSTEEMAKASRLAAGGFAKERRALNQLIKRINAKGEAQETVTQRLDKLTAQEGKLVRQQTRAVEKGNVRRVAALEVAIQKNRDLQAELQKDISLFNRLKNLPPANLSVNVTTTGFGNDAFGRFSGPGGKRFHAGGVLQAGQTGIIRQNEAVITPAGRTEIRPLGDSNRSLNVTLRPPPIIIAASSILDATGRGTRTNRVRANA